MSRHWLVLILACTIFISGCSNLNDENSSSNNDSSSGNDPVATVAEACYENEQYIDKEDICSIQISCDQVETCESWGDSTIVELEELYGSFIDYEASEYIEGEEALAQQEEAIIVTYSVDGNDLVTDGRESDEALYEQMWSEFAWIIPQDQREMLTSFSVFTHVDTLAYVVQEETDWEKWSLGINVDQSLPLNEKIATIVHEFGHLLFLNKDEIDPHTEEEACEVYYLTDDGCPYEDSYLLPFKEQFWTEEELEFDENSFVTEYAAENLVEDMAETFMVFVLSEKPHSNALVDEKVLFFYQYEDLVMLRAEILSRIYSYMQRTM